VDASTLFLSLEWHCFRTGTRAASRAFCALCSWLLDFLIRSEVSDDAIWNNFRVPINFWRFPSPFVGFFEISILHCARQRTESESIMRGDY
jgi:hypothetical protein